MPYAYLCRRSTTGIGRLFIFRREPNRRMTQTFFTIAELALHYGGIGGWATNKQRAKCKTFALLATIISKSGPETQKP